VLSLIFKETTASWMSLNKVREPTMKCILVLMNVIQIFA
jgi:hypothetical protein